MKEKVAFYPFCSEFIAFVKHFDKLQEQYSLQKVYAPSGFGLLGKDVAHACNYTDVGMIVSEFSDASDPAWQILMIAEPMNREVHQWDELARDIGEATLKEGKSVHYYTCSERNIPYNIAILKKAYPDSLVFSTAEAENIKFTTSGNDYALIDVPVILVGGLITEAETFEIICSIANCFRTDGLHPLVLSKSALGALFGFYSASHITDNLQLREAEKIYGLNSFVQEIIRREMPDIVVLEAPGAVMRLNDKVPSDCGIRAMIMCEAVAPDYLVCCVPFEICIGDLLSAFSDRFTISLGSPITGVHISNIIIDGASMTQNKKITVTYADLSNVEVQLEKEAKTSEIPMYDMVEDGTDELCLFIRNELEFIQIGGMLNDTRKN